MFRKTITTLTLSAIAAVAMITLLAPAPASAIEPGLCFVDILTCIAEAAGAFDDDEPETTPVPALELEVTAGVTSDAVIETVMQLPEGVVDALSEPVVELPSDVDLEEAIASPTDDGSDSEGADEVLPDAVPETEVATDPAPEATDESSPIVTAEPASVPEAQQVTVSVSVPGTTTATSGEEAVAAVSLTADVDSPNGLDPMMAALFGGLGVLAIVMIMLTAFSLGRRSS